MKFTQALSATILASVSLVAAQTLSGHFEGGSDGAAPAGFFDVGCGQQTGLESLPPGYTVLVIDHVDFPCQIEVDCVTGLIAGYDNAGVYDLCTDSGNSISLYNASCTSC